MASGGKEPRPNSTLGKMRRNDAGSSQGLSTRTTEEKESACACVGCFRMEKAFATSSPTWDRALLAKHLTGSIRRDTTNRQTAGGRTQKFRPTIKGELFGSTAN